MKNYRNKDNSFDHFRYGELHLHPILRVKITNSAIQATKYPHIEIKHGLGLILKV